MAVIAVDFDDTLVTGELPMIGAKDAINLIREKGHKVIVHSCNSVQWIKKVLDNHDIRYDYVYGEDGNEGCKLLADIYVDDRGYHFQGNWANEVHKILERVEGKDNRKW